MEWPSTKDDARSAGLKYYQTGAPCIHGHVAERLVSTGACAECNRIRSREEQRKKWAADPEAMKKKAREAYQAKPEHYRAKAREWRDDNLEKQREYERQWRKDNAEKVRAMDRAQRIKDADRNREYDRKWRDENRGLYRSYQRHRQTLKTRATPPWLTEDQLEAIRAVYMEAARLEKATGILHEVDHIIPLNHPDVCGWHVPWNLQILSRDENRMKSNQFDGGW